MQRVTRLGIGSLLSSVEALSTLSIDPLWRELAGGVNNQDRKTLLFLPIVMPVMAPGEMVLVSTAAIHHKLCKGRFGGGRFLERRLSLG